MTTERAKHELQQMRTGRSFNANKIMSKIKSVKQPYRDMLCYRYVQAMTWREIAEKMAYSQDHLRGYMNKRAVEKFAEAE